MTTTEVRNRRWSLEPDRPGSDRAIASGHGRAALATALLSIAIAVASWPIRSVSPLQFTFDPTWSWMAGLHVAAERGLSDEIGFSYGPLGFLTVPLLVHPTTATLAFAFTALLRVAFCFVLLEAGRRVFSLPIAIAVAVVVASLVQGAEVVSFVLLFPCVALVANRLSPTVHRAFPIVAGVVAAAALLMKFNVGALCIAMAVVALATGPGRRAASLAAFTAALVVASLVLWTASAGSPVTMIEWLERSIQVVQGYSVALALEEAGRDGEYLGAAVLVWALAALARRETADLSRRARLGTIALCALFAFAYFKAGFVRHDAHSALFFVACAVLALALAGTPRVRWLTLGTIAVAAGLAIHATRVGPLELVNPVRASGDVFDQLSLMTSPSRRDALLADARETHIGQLKLDSRTISLVEGHTVNVDPYDISAVWALDVPWRPIPVLQTYASVNAALDDANAAVLTGPEAPERLLRRHVPVRIDYKAPQFESPAYFLETLCRYRELYANREWQVLARTGDRCGDVRKIGSVRAREDELVRVPAGRADALVFATLDIRSPLVERLQILLFKAATTPRIDLDGGRTYRFVPTTASNPLVLRVPAAIGYSAPFGQRLSTTTFVLRNVHSPFTVEFFATPVRPSR